MPRQQTNWIDRQYRTKDEAIAALLAALANVHPIDHAYKEIEGYGICDTCGWAHPNGPIMPCGIHTARGHIQVALEELTGPDGDDAFINFPEGRDKILLTLQGQKPSFGVMIGRPITFAQFVAFLRGL